MVGRDIYNLQLVRKAYSKFGRISSSIKETTTILRCKGKSVAPYTVTITKLSYDEFSCQTTGMSVIIKINT